MGQLIDEFAKELKGVDELQRQMKDLVKGSDPLQIAKIFIKLHPIYFDRNLIWWVWNEKKKSWESIDETDIMNALQKALDLQGVTYGSTKASFINALKMAGRDNQPEELSKDELQFGKEIVNVKTGEKKPSSSKYFSLNPIPWKIGESEDTPTIDKLFEDWVGQENKQKLYEICAFALNSEYFPQRIIILVGKGCNGKGTFLIFLERFVGKSNCTSSDLDLLMDNRFETMKLYRKNVCFMGETNFSQLKNTARLKGLTGNDLVNFEIKGGKNFSERNYAKLIISSNSLPTTSDKTDGFYRRMFIIDWDRQFGEHKDVLAQIPLVEYENLVRKSIRILRELNERGSFTGEGSIEDRRARYEEHSDPLQHFIEEQFKPDPNEEVKSFEFTNFFTSWLNQRGYRRLNDVEIGRQLKLKGFEKKVKHYTKANGEQGGYVVILGLKWKSAERPEGDEGVFSLHSLYRKLSGKSPSSPSSLSPLSDAVLMPCSRCGTTEIPCTFEDKQGKPYCKVCQEFIDNQEVAQ